MINTAENTVSIKKSYFNILTLFLEQGQVDARYFRCLLKWALQLNLNNNDLSMTSVEDPKHRFALPGTQVDRLEAIYHLVYLIHLDNTVEDVELEVATIFAKKLGFTEDMVSELFTAIVTAGDDDSMRDLRGEVLRFLQEYEANR